MLEKVATIDRCLRRAEEARDPERRLEPQDREHIVEHRLADLRELCRRILSSFAIR